MDKNNYALLSVLGNTYNTSGENPDNWGPSIGLRLDLINEDASKNHLAIAYSIPFFSKKDVICGEQYRLNIENIEELHRKLTWILSEYQKTIKGEGE